MSLEASESIRKKILAQRRSLSAENTAQLSEEALSHFLKLFPVESLQSPSEGKPFRKAKVALYKAFPSELSLDRLEAIFRKAGWLTFFPRTLNDQSLEFVEVRSEEEAHWSIGRYGVSEPGSALKGVAADQMDLIFVPGVAFGPQGERIGRGKGYYDRTLSQNSQALRIALAFDFQVQPKLEQKPWDQPVHWIVTEAREFKTDTVASWLSRFRLTV